MSTEEQDSNIEESGVAKKKWGSFTGHTPEMYKRRRKGTIDWLQVRNAYVYAEPTVDKKRTTYRYPSLENIAKEYKITPQMLYTRAAREGWSQRRKDYHRKIKELHEREVDMLHVRKSALLDSENIARLEMMGQIFDSWIAENNQVPQDVLSEREKAAYNELCAEEGFVPDEDDTGLTARFGGSDRLPGDVYDDEGNVRSTASIKDINMAMDVMIKMHKMSRDILGEPINYEKFYAEKIAEEKKMVEKGKAVTRSDIRDLIASMKDTSDATKESNAHVTLDVKSEEVNDVTE